MAGLNEATSQENPVEEDTEVLRHSHVDPI